MNAKICLACEKPIKGRSDKKFCDAACRNTYNNHLNSDITPLMRNINNVLRKNRRILEELLMEARQHAISIDKLKLAARGFHFTYSTEQYTTEKMETYIYCYEYGYKVLPDNKLLVVKDTRKRSFKQKLTMA